MSYEELPLTGHDPSEARAALDESASSGTDTFAPDPFVPFEDVGMDSRYNIITLRVVLVGCLCGILVNASNIYLGLKTGWTSSANVLGVCSYISSFPCPNPPPPVSCESFSS